MHRLILALLVLAAIGVVVGETLRGAWGSGLILGGMVVAATWNWWRLRRSTDLSASEVADPIAIYMVFLASALAVWPEVEAWVARVLG